VLGGGEGGAETRALRGRAGNRVLGLLELPVRSLTEGCACKHAWGCMAGPQRTSPFVITLEGGVRKDGRQRVAQRDAVVRQVGQHAKSLLEVDPCIIGGVSSRSWLSQA
jgi:hypothetical protein